MAVHHLCDRCGKDLNQEAYQRGMIARLKRGLATRWKFWGVMPQKSGFNDMWELNRTHIDLCQSCTKEFFKFVQTKPKASNKSSKKEK